MSDSHESCESIRANHATKPHAVDPPSCICRFLLNGCLFLLSWCNNWRKGERAKVTYMLQQQCKSNALSHCKLRMSWCHCTPGGGGSPRPPGLIQHVLTVLVFSELKVTHLRCRSPICGFLRKSAVSCALQMLEFPGEGVHLRKSVVFCKNLCFGLSLSP